MGLPALVYGIKLQNLYLQMEKPPLVEQSMILNSKGKSVQVQENGHAAKKS